MILIRFHPFLCVQMILINILNTQLKRNFVMNSYIALYQFDSFSQRVDLVGIKGHYYFLMLFFLWKI